MNLFNFVSLLIVFGVSSGEDISLEAIIQRLEYLENKVSDLQDQNIELQLQVTQCKMQQEDSKKSRVPELTKRFVLEATDGVVAFTAAITPVVVNHVKPSEIIQFDSMVTNVGGGYNNQTGVFVAPVTGIYLFSCSLLDHTGVHLKQNGAMVHGELVHNQRVLARIFAHATTLYRDQGAQTVLAEVKQGDQVFVRTIDNPDLGLGGEFYSTFSGYLLQML